MRLCVCVHMCIAEPTLECLQRLQGARVIDTRTRVHTRPRTDARTHARTHARTRKYAYTCKDAAKGNTLPRVQSNILPREHAHTPTHRHDRQKSASSKVAHPAARPHTRDLYSRARTRAPSHARFFACARSHVRASERARARAHRSASRCGRRGPAGRWASGSPPPPQACPGVCVCV